MRIEAPSSSCNDVVPPSLTALVEKIKSAPTTSQFVEELERARSLQAILSKTELSRWADVLDRCDDVLAATTMIEENRLRVDFCMESKRSTMAILRFTSLLFECTSTRRIYASTDRLLALLESSDLAIVADVLRLLQTIGKRSKFLPTRLPPADQSHLVEKLTAIAQCWGGRLRSVKMGDCVAEENAVPNVFPFSYSDGKGNTASLENRPDESEPLLAIVDRICQNMEREHRYTVLSRLRMLRLFHVPEHRMQCLVIRLLSISTLIYCRCQPDETQINALVYPGFIEETAALLKIPLSKHALVDAIQAESLRTLTSVVSLEKSPKVAEILDSLGANSYHGFIAVFTRMLVEDIKKNELGTPGKPSVALGTALFSFIYHISNIETGGEKLMSCGLAQTLLSLIEHKELSLDLISFATRCSRIIDTFTTLDVSAFRTLKGMDLFIDRLVHEIDECRKDQPFVIDTTGDNPEDESYKFIPVKTPVVDKRCHQLRTGLIKGLLTFIKRIINVPEMQDSVRTIMEGALPDALLHIISNAEYYSDSIYHHTLQLLTNFIYQEPAQLTQLQKRHVPFVMLQSMLRKELPNSRDVIGNLGNVFTALCLNDTGLRQFKSYRPFDHVFKIVMSIKFLATLKKKRSEMHDAATTIGAALDDLLRHQPTLKPLMLDSVIEALDTLNNCAKEPPANTKIVMALSKVASKAAYQNFSSGSGGNSPEAEQAPQEEEMVFSPRDDDVSDEDDEADLSMDEASSIRQATVDKMGLEMDCPSELNDGSRVLPLGDYLLIFTKIFEAVVTQAQASDLIEGFVEKDGIEKLLALSQVQPISQELANSNFGQSVAAIIQYLLTHRPAGERLMSALDSLFSKHAAALPKVEDCSGGSYLSKLGVNVLSDALSYINGTLPILISLSKIPYGGSQYSSERRGRVAEAWLTPTGKLFHKNLRRTSRYLTWESTLIRVIEDTKVPVSTQTDPVKQDELEPMENEGATAVDSVAVERPKNAKPAWELAGIDKDVVKFWTENKTLSETLLKANKQICEFVTLVSRGCYAQIRRNRRYDYNNYAHPKTTARMADEVFTIIYSDLKYVPPWGHYSPMEFGRLSEVLNQLSGVLFDERRQPYHAMLDKFYSSGCHQAFCDILIEKLAPALEGPSCGQLDTAFSDWFKLAERLANKQKLMHSLYRQSSNNHIFDPEKYSRLVHSDFFRVLSTLFGKLSGENVNLRNYQSLCEEAIAVYKEVAESLIPCDESDKQGGTGVGSLQEDNIRSLVEMGFEREAVILALQSTNNVGEATEFLITRHQPAEVDPLMQAREHGIFVDIGNPRNEEENDGRLSAGSDENPGGEAAAAPTSSAAPDGVAAPIIIPLRELTIDKDVSISQACIELMPLCKRLLEFGSELVFSCADLFISVIGSLDDEWKRNELINSIMLVEIIEMIKKVLSQSTNEDLAVILATRIHFSCLLFEHVADDYLQMCNQEPMVSTVLSLLSHIYDHFDAPCMHEKLLPPTVLWLDLYDKCCRAAKRKEMVLRLVPQKNLKWSFMGDENDPGRYSSRSTKKWVQYQQHCQDKLNKAFFAGKSKTVIRKRDKEVTVDFAMLSEKDNDIHKHNVNVELPELEDFSITAQDILESERTSVWSDAQKSDLLVQVVRMLHKGQVHHTAAHSLLSFVARLTRDSVCAEQFLRDGGVAAVIKLRSSSTPCSASLASLILRQCVDCDEFTRSIFEKSVRQCTSINNAHLEFLGISDTRPKEWHDTLNKLAPLAARQSELYVDVMEKSVKMVAGSGSHSDTLCAQHIGKATKTSSDNTTNMNAVVTLLLNEVLSGEWPNESDLPLGHGRMLSRGGLLNLLSELVKTYGVAATLVCEAKSESQSILLSLLDRYIGHEDKDTLRSLKVLIAVLSTCNHSPKAQESLVTDVKACLLSICDTPSEPAVICQKLSELCSLIIHMAETPTGHHSRSGHTPPINPILKLFHKKKVCNDLVRAITYMRLGSKEAVDTTSEILRTLETLMRFMNANSQPHSALGDPATMPRTVRGLLSLDELFGDDEHRRRLDVLDNAFFREIADNDVEHQDVAALERNLEDLRQQMRNLEQGVAAPINAAENEIHAQDEEEDGGETESSMSDGEDPIEAESADEEEEEEEMAEEHAAHHDDTNQDSVGDDEDQNETGMELGDADETVEEHNEEETEDDDEDEDDDGEEYENDHPFDEDRDVIDEYYGDMDRPALMMDGLMDDWDSFPAGVLATGRHARRQQNTNTTHPLLVRPHHIVDAHPSSHVFTVPFDYHHIVGGGPLALTRQNAIRRLGGSSRSRPVEPRRMIFDRLFDMQDGSRMIHSGINSNRDAEDQRLRASIPSALERITEGADLLEPLSIRFLALIINAIVTTNADKLYKAEKAQREQKILLKHKDEVAAAATGAGETATVVAPPQAEVARPAWEGAAEQPAEGEAGNDQEEAMDVTEQNAIREDASDAPPPSSAATVASSLPEDDDQTTADGFSVQMEEDNSPPNLNPAAQEDVPMETEPPVNFEAPAVERDTTEEAAAAPNEAPPRNDIPEEYRAILGDITIPEGVDPAFLAALPDDMRAEVIRDIERQQRAQRATATVPAPAAVVEGEAAAAVPVVEPLDQEFLNALPPELQEEILAQHERAVREAEEAIRRANEPPPPPQQEMDGAAVIASLSAREREQVLTEMDDTDLQRLPQAMQEEARRYRSDAARRAQNDIPVRDMLSHFGEIQSQMIQRNVMRIHNLYVRNGGGAGGHRHMRTFAVPAGTLTSSATDGRFGLAAGRASTASSQAVQLVDRESIIILCGLFLLDNRTTVARLQKVIRLICSHAPSCDFVLWCLQGFLNKASEGTVEDEEVVSVCPEWLDSISVPGGGHNERSVKIGKGAGKVFVHPVVSGNVCRSVLEAMHTLARAYPGHFLPTALRAEQLECKQWPARDTFWQLLQNPSGKAVGKEPVDHRSAAEQFSTSPLAHLVQYFNKQLFSETSCLQDRLFKVIQAVVQTLPDDTISRLELNAKSTPLEEEMKILVGVLTKGSCGTDGFADGRNVLLELMRALSPEISRTVYDNLCDSIVSIGIKLQPQIENLLTEMGEVSESGEDTPQASTSAEKGRITSARLAGDSVVVDGDAFSKMKMSMYVCREMRLPAMMALTDKSGAQYNLLSSLQTLTKIRDTMRARKLKKIDEEKKKAAEIRMAPPTSDSTTESPDATDVTTSAVTVEPVTTTTSEATTSSSVTSGLASSTPSTAQSASTEAAQPSSSAASVATAKPQLEPVELINVEIPETRLSQRLAELEGLWNVVSACLQRLGKASDPHAVLALHPAAEAFFLTHAVPKSSTNDHEHPDNVRMIDFAEKHREVLNQVLRQNSQALSSGGPFTFLTQFPKLLDFDVKRKFFRKELVRIDGEQGRFRYRRSDVNVQVRRSHLFSDSFRELFRLRPQEWKKRFYIVFQGEEGQDAGGLLREWFSVITREIFNPNYALFITAPGDMVTYMINKASYINPEHLDYFKFVGRLIAKAIYDNKLLDCYFTRAFYKHILNVPVRYQDIESEDPAFFKSLEFLLNNPINDLGLDLTFSLEVEEFGVRAIRDLKPDGRKIEVTDENKVEYVNLVCQMKMTGSIQKQLDSFLAGFYEVIPKSLISMFNEQEMELLISGLPDVDIDDLANNTEYKSYNKTSPQIQWFWRALRSYEAEDRAKFLQFVTGTSKVPLQGFASLEGMNGVQKFSIHMDSRGGDRLPAAHTCFNQLDLPQYESYEKLRDCLLMAVRECTEGFGFA